MQLTRQTDYAMRAVLYLATSPLASIKQIAEAQSIPQEYLAKILQKLAKEGIVTTHRGVGGGVSLARAPEKISMLDVIEAIEGKVSLNRCFVHPRECPREKFCAMHDELDRIGSSLASMFAKVNFARMARDEAARIGARL
ncbi:MAG: Rrf2 family transcriptional regulator [Actinobacteria bacterium]|nr:Rrf2 family transcriptional regulator [Actinomycetota bacterium]